VPEPTEPQSLPDYQALLAVDVKDFSGRRGRDHAALTEQIPQMLRAAFAGAGLQHAWSAATFVGPTGDGLVAGFRSALLPFLLNPLLGALQDELAARNRAAAAEQPVRMRVAAHVGPVTPSGPVSISDGSGNARVEIARLVDADEVRSLLARSGDATCVAAVVSQRVFEDAVLTGYAAEPPDLYVPVALRVKSFRSTAYLRVPHPSGDLVTRGLLPAPGGGEVTPVDRHGHTGETAIVNNYGASHSGVGDQHNVFGAPPRGRTSGDR